MQSLQKKQRTQTCVNFDNLPTHLKQYILCFLDIWRYNHCKLMVKVDLDYKVFFNYQPNNKLQRVKDLFYHPYLINLEYVKRMMPGLSKADLAELFQIISWQCFNYARFREHRSSKVILELMRYVFTTYENLLNLKTKLHIPCYYGNLTIIEFMHKETGIKFSEEELEKSMEIAVLYNQPEIVNYLFFEMKVKVTKQMIKESHPKILTLAKHLCAIS